MRPGFKCAEGHDLLAFMQACIVTLCGGAAPRGAPVRKWKLFAPQCPRLRRLSCGAVAHYFSGHMAGDQPLPGLAALDETSDANTTVLLRYCRVL
jgi:hypothetical protein